MYLDKSIKIKNVVINIGCNDLNVSPSYLCANFATKFNGGLNIKVFDVSIKASTYLGQKEDTIVLNTAFFGNTTKSMFFNFFTNLCSLLNQECIAYKVNGTGFLVYNVNFESEKQLFNNQYFIH